ncbi:MAG: hypothetical protein O3C68_01195 [Proteobacteria bacterium]|nr:hypothetical protein [Pseudomonadota bacterium]
MQPERQAGQLRRLPGGAQQRTGYQESKYADGDTHQHQERVVSELCFFRQKGASWSALLTMY